MSKHAVVWIDHKEARVFHEGPEGWRDAHVPAPAHHLHRHPRGGEEPSRHPDDAKRFYAEVARTLEDAKEILVCGPSTAKLHFLKYISKANPGLSERVVGVETSDHPTDGQLIAHARHYFVSADLLRR